jgi:uncharacterized Ntn-hydrolase superfamily protein
MTYSIVARCARTGRLGVGSATFSLACGARSEGARPGIGVSRTQAFPKRANDPLVLNIMQLGFSPKEAMRMVAANDPDFEYRQMGIVSPDGAVAMHTGNMARPWAGHEVGADFAAFGNVLAGRQVIEGIAAGFQAQPEADLADRLLRALEGGRDAGGQMGASGHITERSAWIRVIDRRFTPLVDLRVDVHASAVDQLRHIYTEFLVQEEGLSAAAR